MLFARQSRPSAVPGLQTDAKFKANHALWQHLLKVAGATDGFEFVIGSLLLSSVAVVVVPRPDGQA